MTGNPSKKTAVRSIARNKRAFHEFTISERFEAGIELKGPEVKSLREGKAVLQESFAAVENGELILKGLHISPYEPASRFNPDPKRPRRLLLHKTEIAKLRSAVEEKGLTIIPLSLYFKGHLVKAEIGIAKGKALFDKRDTLKKREAERQIDRAMRESRR